MIECEAEIKAMLETINSKERDNKELNEKDFKILFLNALLQESVHE